MKSSTLLDVLNKASSALSAQDFIPILSHFCFDGEAVTAYNDIQAIKIKLPEEIKAEIRGGVPGQLLLRTLASYGDSKITVDQPSKNMLEIRCGRSLGKFAVLGEEMFLFSTDDLDLEDAVEIPLTSEFSSAIQKCLVSVGNDPTHPFQLGVTFEYSKKGITLYSTDNVSISRYVIPKSTASKKGSVIVPESFCNVLLSFLKSYKTEDAVLKIGEGFAYVTIDDEVELFTKLVHDNHPIDFASVIEHWTAGLDFDNKQETPPDFQSVVDRSLIFHSKIVDKAMLCKVDGKVVVTHTEAEGVGRIKDDVSFGKKITDEPFQFKVDPQNIARVMTFCNDILITPGVTIFFTKNYTHLVGYYKE